MFLGISRLSRVALVARSEKSWQIDLSYIINIAELEANLEVIFLVILGAFESSWQIKILVQQLNSIHPPQSTSRSVLQMYHTSKIDFCSTTFNKTLITPQNYLVIITRLSKLILIITFNFFTGYNFYTCARTYSICTTCNHRFSILFRSDSTGCFHTYS